MAKCSSNNNNMAFIYSAIENESKSNLLIMH